MARGASADEASCMSAAHTAELVDETIAVAAEVFAGMA